MAFSERTKQELVRVIPSARCCRLAELSAFYDFHGYLLGRDQPYLDFYSSSPLAARKILTLIKGLYPDAFTQTLVQRARARKHQVFTVRVPSPADSETIYEAMHSQPVTQQDAAVLRKKCCQRAYLRGSFISQGSVTNPERTYHLEISSDKTTTADTVLATFHALGLEARRTQRKGVHVIYLKDGEQIVYFLNVIGAHSALLHLENIRVVKGMRNQVNRLVNCETANVDKTVKAAMEQVEMIYRIHAYMGLHELSENLQQVAETRLRYPYVPLKELGELVDPPLSKSGVNYRMRQLLAIGRSLPSLESSQDAGEDGRVSIEK